MAQIDQERMKEKLLSLRERLLEEFDTTARAVRDDVAPPNAVTTLPTHKADQDSEGLDKDVEVGKNQEETLREVEAALERIESGEYGGCQECGGEIPAERLEALPQTPYCIDCERTFESGTP